MYVSLRFNLYIFCHCCYAQSSDLPNDNSSQTSMAKLVIFINTTNYFYDKYLQNLV